MVEIHKKDGEFVIEVQGMHKLWAFKDSIRIKPEQIKRVHRDTDNVSWWTGWRIPGTSLPYVIKAGTYFWGGEKEFWDVCKLEKSIIIELNDHSYNRLVVEVEDAAAAIHLLESE